MNDATGDRYFFVDDQTPVDPISGEAPISLKYHAGGQWKQSKSGVYMPCYNPSTGAVIAQAPQCSADEVEEAVQAAKAAFPGWSTTPVSKRVQVLYKMKMLLDENLEELTVLLGQGDEQEIPGGHGRHPQGHRGGGVRLRCAAPDEGRGPDAGVHQL